MSTKIQIIGSSIKQAENADMLGGKHAEEFAGRDELPGVGFPETRSAVFGNTTTNKATGPYSLTYGRDSLSSSEAAFSGGVGCKATSYAAFSVGDQNESSFYNAFSGGSGCKARHANAVTIGRALKTGKGNQAVFGQYNLPDANTLLEVGKGTSEDTRGNAFAVKTNGDVLVGNSTVHNGADYAEFFEWYDGNPTEEDRIGLIVALDGEKIRPAMPGDDVLGIVSGTAAVLGDSAAMHWKDKYMTDEYGRILYDMVEETIEYLVQDTNELIKVSMGAVPQPRLNPYYNPEETYIPREDRPEWAKVGMMGKLYVRDDGTCAVGDYGCPGENGVLTRSETPTNIRVMKRTGDNILWVLLK